jgi:ABC-2 type transport system ATP-binding protein
MSESTRAIEASGLVKTYPGGVRALDGLSFEVEAGTVFGMLGPNGAGKSTTVKILTTLSRPDEGQARVGGFDILRQPDRVRRTIGVVAQRSGVDKEATGRENLRLQGQLFGMGRRGLERRASELLERFGLADAADRIVRTYSGGMQRRLDIALGLIHGPGILFLDEPTTGLDPEVRTGLWEEITRLASEEGITVLLTTHYLEEADRLARRLVIVDRGRIVAEGEPEQLKGELRGDAISIELQDPESNGRVTHALGRLGQVRDVSVDGRSLRARADDGARAVPIVLQTLEASGVRVASVTVARPSLDDVYLRYTGRTFSQAEQQTPEGDRSEKKEARR